MWHGHVDKLLQSITDIYGKDLLLLLYKPPTIVGLLETNNNMYILDTAGYLLHVHDHSNGVQLSDFTNKNIGVLIHVVHSMAYLKTQVTW